jgi:hypothetical protein
VYGFYCRGLAIAGFQVVIHSENQPFQAGAER